MDKANQPVCSICRKPILPKEEVIRLTPGTFRQRAGWTPQPDGEEDVHRACHLIRTRAPEAIQVLQQQALEAAS